MPQFDFFLFFDDALTLCTLFFIFYFFWHFIFFIDIVSHIKIRRKLFFKRQQLPFIVDRKL